jgi:hypothetical protein
MDEFSLGHILAVAPFVHRRRNRSEAPPYLAIDDSASEVGAGLLLAQEVFMARKITAVAALAIVLVAAYASFPRKADLRSFDSAGMAQLETTMWRGCCDKRYGALFYQLYESTRVRLGFPPLHSMRIALAAAQAAKALQPTRSRAEAGEGPAL